MSTISFDYEALRQSLDAEYKIAEYSRKVEALDMVRDMARGAVAQPRAKSSAINANGDSPSSLLKAVRAVLPQLPNQFTNEMIIREVESRYSRFKPININSLRAVIHKLKKNKELRPISVGGGSRRTLYERGE